MWAFTFLSLGNFLLLFFSSSFAHALHSVAMNSFMPFVVCRWRWGEVVICSVEVVKL